MWNKMLAWKSSVTALLFFGLLIFSGAVIWSSIVLPSDEKLFAFLSGIALSFSGSLFTYLQLRKHGGKDDE